MEYRSPFKEKPCEEKEREQIAGTNLKKKVIMNNVFRRYNSVLE